MQITKTANPPIKAQSLGSVEDVINSTISPDLLNATLQAKDILYGFELASPKGPTSLGEAIIVNGTCYTLATDPNTKEYGKTISGQTYTPGGLFILPHGSLPTHLVHHSHPMSMEAFYKTVMESVQHPFAFVALVHFDTLHVTGIGKAPIFGENIFEKRETYYPKPPKKYETIQAYMMGVVAKRDRLKEKGLSTVLYDNPMDTAAKLVHHTHVLTLKRPVETIEEIEPSVVNQSLHLLQEETRFSKIDGQIFTIGETCEY